MRIRSLLFGLIMSAQPAVAETVLWTDWTTIDEPHQIAQGTVGGVSVTLTTTDVINPVQVDGGVWGNLWGANPETYIGGGVDNGPPDADMVGFVGGGVQTLTFSEPVSDPVIAIISLGSAQVMDYVFNDPFSILSSGPNPFSGGAPPPPLTNPSGNVLRGSESSGIIRFSGTFTTLTWDIPVPEIAGWQAIQVAIAPSPPPNPVPTLGPWLAALMSVLLAAAGIVSLSRSATKHPQ